MESPMINTGARRRWTVPALSCPLAIRAERCLAALSVRWDSGQDDFYRADSYLSVAGLRKTVLAIPRQFDFPGQAEISEQVAATSVENPDFRGCLAKRLNPTAFHPTLVPGRVLPGVAGLTGCKWQGRTIPVAGRGQYHPTPFPVRSRAQICRDHSVATGP
jgi:hypothetical protein